VLRLLGALGDPQRAVPPVIHVAGTNGKGSVIAYLQAILQNAGYRVHAYTSPHLVRFNERIVIDGEPIGDAALIALLEEAEAANQDAPITYFEITTVAAFLAFARAPADILLLETGLGGRLDATNVIERPLLSLLTPIALDHQNYLGDTLPLIAAEKAGILKAGVPVVIGPQHAEVETLLDDRAAVMGAPAYRHGRDWHSSETRRGFRYRGRDWNLALPAPGLPGRHQVTNAGMAVAALETVADRFEIPAAAIRRGLDQARWPGRLQRLRSGPLIDALPPGWSLWLDGGHNPEAGRALANFVATAERGPVDLVVGMLESKDAREFIAAFAGRVRRIRTVAIPGQGAAISAEELAAIANDTDIAAEPAESVADAVLGLVSTAESPATILICGSLYLAGHVLAQNG